jgi:hypothetical protein
MPERPERSSDDYNFSNYTSTGSVNVVGQDDNVRIPSRAAIRSRSVSLSKVLNGYIIRYSDDGTQMVFTNGDDLLRFVQEWVATP